MLIWCLYILFDMPWYHYSTRVTTFYLKSVRNVRLCWINVSYLILSYLILSYLILSYLILPYLILPYLILSYLILSCYNLAENTMPLLDNCRKNIPESETVTECRQIINLNNVALLTSCWPVTYNYCMLTCLTYDQRHISIACSH